MCLALLAAGAFRVKAVDDFFIYDRALISRGELWRAWTGHVVHFGSSHILWNLAVFLPVGIWLERLRPGLTRGFYVVCPLFISIALWFLDPTLFRYAGLSGLATGMLVLLAGLQLERRPQEPAWLWWSVLILVGTKIGVELFSGKPLLVSGFTDIRTVPLAHIFGAGCGVAFLMGARVGKSLR
jgi:rhomboid family GlyGly-CTERM serine protease